MASKFCLSHRYQLVGFYDSRFYDNGDRIGHDQSPVNQGSHGKPCEELKNRIKSLGAYDPQKTLLNQRFADGSKGTACHFAPIAELSILCRTNLGLKGMH